MSSSLFFKKHQPWITIDAIDVPFYQLLFLQPYLCDEQMRAHNHRSLGWISKQTQSSLSFLIKGDQTLLSKKKSDRPFWPHWLPRSLFGLHTNLNMTQLGQFRIAQELRGVPNIMKDIKHNPQTISTIPSFHLIFLFSYNNNLNAPTPKLQLNYIISNNQTTFIPQWPHPDDNDSNSFCRLPKE